MNHNLTKIIIGMISIILFISCEKDQDQIEETFNSVKIIKWITISDGAIDTIKFVYNDNNLLIKGNHYGGSYFTNEYDDSNRLISNKSYSSSGLYHYFTFQYDSNSITRIRYQYYPFQDSWGGDNEKSVYCYDSQNHCERIDYYGKNDNGDWIKSDYFTLCTWVNDNLTELKHYKGKNLEYAETYQYDNKLNPEKLLNYMISPWTKSKNNMISSSTKYSDGRETKTTYEYSYNEYGYPTMKTRIDDIGSTEKFEYEFN